MTEFKLDCLFIVLNALIIQLKCPFSIRNKFFYGIKLFITDISTLYPLITFLLQCSCSWAAIPFMYLLTRLCRYVATAYLLVFLVNFFVGLATTMVMFLLYQTSYEQVGSCACILSKNRYRL